MEPRLRMTMLATRNLTYPIILQKAGLYFDNFQLCQLGLEAPMEYFENLTNKGQCLRVLVCSL